MTSVTSESTSTVLSCTDYNIKDINSTLKSLCGIQETTDIKLHVDGVVVDMEDGNALVGGMSTEVAKILSIVSIVSICPVLSFFGIIANILNMIVFRKQGFQDTVNISLFSMSVSDLCSAVTLLWLGFCQNPLVNKADLPFIPTEIEALTSGIPHAIAITLTAWLTAFVTFERCLCVVFPLKVKDIITLRRTKIIIVAIFALVIGGQMPSYYTLRLKWRFVPERNKTLLGIYVPEGSQLIDTITFYVVNITSPVLCFILVAIGSIILIIEMNLRSKWRQTTTTQGTGDSGKEGVLTSKDWRVIKMISIVAVIFVTSFTPHVFISVVMTILPDFRFYGKFRAAFSICVSIGAFLESINALCNIFIYYRMSSKYKATFDSLFCAGKEIKTK